MDYAVTKTSKRFQLFFSSEMTWNKKCLFASRCLILVVFKCLMQGFVGFCETIKVFSSQVSQNKQLSVIIKVIMFC